MIRRIIPGRLFLVAVALADQSLFVSLSDQESLSATGDNLSWSIWNDGLSLSGDGISSLAWRSWDESQVREIYLLGNFSINARQTVNLSGLVNDTNETEELV